MKKQDLTLQLQKSDEYKDWVHYDISKKNYKVIDIIILDYLKSVTEILGTVLVILQNKTTKTFKVFRFFNYIKPTKWKVSVDFENITKEELNKHYSINIYTGE